MSNPTTASLLKKAVRRHEHAARKSKAAAQTALALSGETRKAEDEVRRLATQLIAEKVGPDIMKALYIFPHVKGK